MPLLLKAAVKDDDEDVKTMEDEAKDKVPSLKRTMTQPVHKPLRKSVSMVQSASDAAFAISLLTKQDLFAHSDANGIKLAPN